MQNEFDWATRKQSVGAPLRMPPAGRLFHAIKGNNVHGVHAVLRDGFDLRNFWIGGKPFLRIAGEKNKRAICEVLVRYGADPNESDGKRNYSLLHHAVASSNYGFASILLDLGAAPSPLTSNHATPLHFAARTNQEYLARKLIKSGADVNAQDTLGRSPLLLAFQKANAGVAKLLVANRGNPKLPDKSGLTPQMVAEQKGPPYSSMIMD